MVCQSTVIMEAKQGNLEKFMNLMGNACAIVLGYSFDIIAGFLIG